MYKPPAHKLRASFLTGESFDSVRRAKQYSLMRRKSHPPEKKKFETLTAALVALTALAQAFSKIIELIQQHGR
jgi:hypothetical protein